MKKMISSRRSLIKTGLLLGAAVVASAVLAPKHASAQLGTRHYLAPAPGFENSSLVLQVSTPAPADIPFTVASKLGDLFSGNAKIAGISTTVKQGFPFAQTFTRNNGQNSSGLLSNATLKTATPLDQFGMVLKSDVAVLMIASPNRSNNRAILTSKGGNGLGTDFYAWSAFNTTGNAVGSNNDSAHFISVMATEDNTLVQIKSSADIFDGFVGNDDTKNTVTLQALQTFSIVTKLNVSVTGTHVTSDKPITVTSGDMHPTQPAEGEKDGGADQLVPVPLAGTDYVVGNFEVAKSYGNAGFDGVAVGNRYVQFVATEDGTEIEWYNSDGTKRSWGPGGTVDRISLNKGGSAALHTPGAAGAAYYFKGNKPYLMFLNSSAEPGDEMGGVALPTLKGKNSQGSFCSGTSFVEFTTPADTTGFIVYASTDKLGDLQIDNGTGTFRAWNDSAFPAPVRTDFVGGIVPKVTFLRFPGSLASGGTRVAIKSSSRVHVGVGTAVGGATGSFGFFSDYAYAFLVLDPVYTLPTDGYRVTETASDTRPRPIKHCLSINSACSTQFQIDTISSTNGTLSNVATSLTTPDKVCFDFTPKPVPGAGPQTYRVPVSIKDDNGDTRSVEVRFDFEWVNNDPDPLPDALDLDDDNDGILDTVELGGTDFSGDEDLDGVLDWQDTDRLAAKGVTCTDAGADGKCDTLPATLDWDADGIPNHLDLDTDGDGIFDLIEGSDLNADGKNDFGILDANADGKPDGFVDANNDGVDDRVTSTAPLQDRDGDLKPDWRDTDDDDDGLLTAKENYNGGSPANDDTDNDGIPDYLDADDDGDGVRTKNEAPDPNADGDPADARDSNGSAPPDYLDPGSNAASVAENTTAVLTLALPAGVTASIKGGVDGSAFSFDSSTGALRFKSAPNFEAPTDTGTNNVYEVDLEVVDGTNIVLRKFTVTVTDVDEPPTITSNGGTATASIGVAAGTKAVTTVVAADPEKTAVSYAIDSGADAALFDLDPSTGVLTFKTAPTALDDADKDGVYVVVVKATDAGGKSSTQTLNVKVSSLEQPLTVAEGTTLALTLPSGTTASIQGGADAALFTFDAATRTLSFKAAPDFEAPKDGGTNNVYDIDLTIDDGSGPVVRKLTVTVTNVDEAPVITSNGGGKTATVGLEIGSKAVTTVVATDPEKLPLTYALDGGADAALFSIDPKTGALTFKTAPGSTPTDANKDGTYVVVVKATDAGGKSVSQTIDVKVSSKDTDKDGVPDDVETRLGTDPKNADSDGDGIPDNVELSKKGGSGPFEAVDTDKDGKIDALDTDSDDDGIPDAVERNKPTGTNEPEDADGDGVPNYRDLDSDDDGIPDSVERGTDGTKPRDTDGDGTADYLDTDSDGDGLLDSLEGSKGATPEDTDGDGVPDYLDLDSDNDCVSDQTEGATTFRNASLPKVDPTGNCPAGNQCVVDNGVGVCSAGPISQSAASLEGGGCACSVGTSAGTDLSAMLFPTLGVLAWLRRRQRRTAQR